MIEGARQPHYVTIATSCHQLSLQVQSGDLNPILQENEEEIETKVNQIRSLSILPDHHTNDVLPVCRKKKSIYFVAKGGLGTEGWYSRVTVGLNNP